MATNPPTLNMDQFTLLMQHLSAKEDDRRREDQAREDRLRQEARDREDHLRREALEREQRARKDADDREERLLTIIRDSKADAKMAAQQQADIQRDRLAYDRERYNLDQERLAREHKDKERREKLKLIPKPQPMSSREDVEEFLELFEINMKDRDIPAEMWAHHLVPLLNSTCKTAIATMDMADKFHYPTLKDLLLATCTNTCKYPGRELLQGACKHGETFRATVLRLGKLAYKYAPEHDASTVRDKIVLEIFLATLPERARNYVREKEPGTACEGADLASKFMAREGLDELKYSTPRGSHDNQDRERERERL